MEKTSICELIQNELEKENIEVLKNYIGFTFEVKFKLKDTNTIKTISLNHEWL